MNKRARLERTFAGEPVDRPPVALWRHWPGDDQRPGDLAAATIAFQQQFDWDFVKVTPSSDYCLRDWGAQTVWEGNNEGTRRYVHHPVQQPEDWAALPVLDPTRGSLGQIREALRLIRQGLGPDVPIIHTIFSPISQAKNLAGPERLPHHLRLHPDALHEGLKRITETTIRYVESLREVGVDGIFYAVQWADAQHMSADEYRAFGRPYDLQILEAAQGLWFNLLHVHGEGIYFDLFVDYPVQALNWHARETWPSLAEGKERFPGAVVGGIRRTETLLRGTPDDVRGEARDAIEQTEGRRFILGTGCVTMITSPLSNLRAARAAVEQ